jgi:hypothetical protein
MKKYLFLVNGQNFWIIARDEFVAYKKLVARGYVSFDDKVEFCGNV